MFDKSPDTLAEDYIQTQITFNFFYNNLQYFFWFLWATYNFIENHKIHRLKKNTQIYLLVNFNHIIWLQCQLQFVLWTALLDHHDDRVYNLCVNRMNYLLSRCWVRKEENKIVKGNVLF